MRIPIIPLLYFSQKQLPRKMKLCLVIIVCKGYIFWQLFLWGLYVNIPLLCVYPEFSTQN